MIGEDARSFDFLAPLHKEKGLSFVRAEGASYFTDKGREYIDMDELSVVLGQSNQAFEDAISAALRKITAPKNEISTKKLELYEYLNRSTGRRFRNAHLTSSGSEAVEAAVRLAKKITGKSEIISFWNSVHGRTYLSGSLSGNPKRKAGCGSLAPGIVFFPYPDCLNCPVEKDKKICECECLQLSQRIYESASAQNAAAILVEPYQGSGDVFPPKGFLKKLQDWAVQNGILLIVDEIKSGMGRTGDMYRFSEEGLDPDILLLGKPLGNGFHISAMLSKAELKAEELKCFAGGSGDNIVCCAAACEVFRQLENGLLEHIRQVGGILQEGLSQMPKLSQEIADCCGAGLTAAVTFRDENFCQKVRKSLWNEGFMVYGEGKKILLNPPYTIKKEQILKFLDCFRRNLL